MNTNKNQTNVLGSGKKTAVPLIFGILSIIFPSLWIISELILEKSFLWSVEDMSKKIPLPLFVFEALEIGLFIAIFILPAIIGIIGLIFGFKSLKSIKKTTAILGIILCISGLLLWAYVVLYVYALLGG